MSEAEKNPYRRLRSQMFLVLLCFGLIPLIAMGIAVSLEYRKATETRARSALESVVKSRTVTVELFLEETMHQLELMTAAFSVEQLSHPPFLESLRTQMQSRGGAIVDLGLLADDGRHVAYVGPYKLSGLDYSGQPWFEQVMVLGSYQSDIFLGYRRFPHMIMAVKKRQGGRDWILRATIDTDRLSTLVREGGLESGADVFILNRAGEYQTHYSDEHRLMEKADISPIRLHSGVRLVEERHSGRRELLATVWLRGESWVLVARQQMPGLSGLMDAHASIIWLSILGLVVVPVLAYVIARHRLKQIQGLEAERAGLYESVAQSQKMAAIGRLAAGVAHEINNPLAIIQAQVGVLSDIVAENPDLPHAAEFKDRIAKVEAQVERGRKVTHRLLGFSRRVGPELEPVNVVAALDETVSFVEKDLETSRIRIVREYSADVPLIRSNLGQMQQVFLNLINNALDAIGQDGELRLGVHGADGAVVVTVGDTGPGIPEADLAKVFEPFFSTKSGDKQHTGLGLAICEEIIRGLGGRISVESAPGTGTVFSVWFPQEAEGA
jgi:two-component system NtrC family sensor kinase